MTSRLHLEQLESVIDGSRRDDMLGDIGRDAPCAMGVLTRRGWLVGVNPGTNLSSPLDTGGGSV